MERYVGKAKALFNNVDCVSMYVDDLDKGIEFYSGQLGLKLLWRVNDSCGLGHERFGRIKTACGFSGLFENLSR